MTRTKSQRRRKKRQWFRAVSAPLILGRTRARRPTSMTHSAALHRLRGLLLALLVLVVTGALWLTFDDRFYVYYADVVGAVHVSPDDVFQSSGLPGLHVLWVRSDEVEKRILAAEPSVESTQVDCPLRIRSLMSGAEPAAECTITIVERRPRMLWDDDGQLWWIDADGVVFAADGAALEMLSERWVVHGPLPQGEDGQLNERVRIALSELWATGMNMSPLYYVSGRGLTFADERGWLVILGQGSGMDRRLQVLEGLVADLEVRFADVPYYSLANEW
jgi:cell division septal protein FtsQ